MILIFGIGAAIFLYWLFFKGPHFSDDWTPYANCEQDGSAGAYKRAAKITGIRLMTGRVVPCPGYALCGGMIGIWIHKDDVRRGHELTDAYFNGKLSKLPPNGRWNYDI